MTNSLEKNGVGEGKILYTRVKQEK